MTDPSTEPTEEPTVQPETQPTPEATRAEVPTVDETIPEPAHATIPTQPPAGQPYPGQPAFQGQPVLPGQPYPGQPAFPGQPLQGQPYAGQPFPNQPVTAQPYPAQPVTGQPVTGQPVAGQPYPGQPFPNQPYPTQPIPGQPFPNQPYPGQPIPGQPYPGQPFAGQPFGMPPGAVPPPPKRKRRTFLIVSLVLVGLLVLCAGVGTTAYVVSKKQSGTGQADPKSAVTAFMTAVYTHRDVTEAEKYVCAQSNNKGQLTSKINELKTADSTYRNPAYSWSDPDVANQTTKEATVTTTVTMTTGDEKQSSENLTFTTLQSNGWWVCEVKTTQ